MTPRRGPAAPLTSRNTVLWRYGRATTPQMVRVTEPQAVPDDRSGSPHDAATLALDLVSELADDKAPLDRDQLELGDAFRSCSIGSEELRHDAAAIDLDVMLSRGGVITFPVRQGDKIVSSVTLTETPEGGWRLEGFGSVNQVSAIAKLRDHDALQRGRDPASYFVVAIPELKLFLVGTESDDGVVVGSVFNNAALGVRAGEWARASDVIESAAQYLNHEADEKEVKP